MTKDKKALREIEQPLYNYWQALYHSFFNNRLYIDVCKRWKGYGVLYFLLLMFIVTLPFSVRIIVDFTRNFQNDIIQPLNQLPPLYIQNGNLSFDKPMPYFIKNNKGNVVTIVDTSGSISSINKATYPNLRFLITKDKILYRFPTTANFLSDGSDEINPTIYTASFDKNYNGVFEGNAWLKSSGLSTLKFFFAFLMYPSIALIFFALFTVFLLALSLMGQFVAKLFGLTISYKQACRLLLVSVTPLMVALWFVLVGGWLPLPAWGGILFLALFVFYFCFAVLSVKYDSQQLVIS